MPFLPALVSRRGRGAAAGGLLLCLAFALGCSKQGEGERCDQNNFDFDCDTGLVCKGEAQLSITGRGVALCCPSIGEPTVDACRATAVLPREPDGGLLPEPLPEPPVIEPVVDAGSAPDAAATP